MSIKGYSSNEKEDRLELTHATVEPVRDGQSALSTVAHMAVRNIASDAAEAGSTAYSIVATAHSARVGDIIRFTSGAHSGREVKVSSVDTNLITLAETLDSDIAAADGFDIKRHTYLKVDSDGNLGTSSGGPIEYVLDSVDQAVTQDTGTPANSKPLPVTLLHPSTGVGLGSTTQPVNVALPSTQNTNLANIATSTASTAINTSSTAANTSNANTLLGAVNETAPANDTASSGLNGRLQRIAQRITSLIGQIPAALGATTASASMSVTIATDDARIGAINETAPANDTADSGLNGRLQRIAQRLTSLIALLPSSLGQKNGGGSLSVILASDQTKVPICDSNGNNINTRSVGTYNAVVVQEGGRSLYDKIRYDYTGGSVTTGAWTQITASTSIETQEIEIFDSSGSVLQLAYGGAGSETATIYIFPGGNGRIPLRLSSGQRLSVKAVDTTASTGQLLINLWG